MQKITTYSTTTQTGNQEKEIINHLFSAMAGIKSGWGLAWRTPEQVSEAKRQWLQGFKENRVHSMELLEIGLKEARRDVSDKVPSIGLFCQWCHSQKPATAAHRRHPNLDQALLDAPLESEESVSDALANMRKGL